ncbi:formylglycine-generating enzyme family protein [Myxococcota bacterium]
MLSAGLLFACSGEDSASSDGGGAATKPQGGAGSTVPGDGTATGGTGATTSGGTPTTSSGGTTPGGTTAPAAGGTTPGGTTAPAAGGTTPGGTTTPGAGGTTPGGTTTPAAGGTTPGGTTTPGAGGTTPGGTTTGGGGTVTGGVETGGGGVETGGAATGGSTRGTVVIADRPPDENYTEEVNGVTFDMVYVPGGTFTIGCESGSCPADTEPVSGVTVSSYHIAKTEMTTELWNAVMGESSDGFGGPSTTWYDAMEFACELSKMTGRAYRMMTEAEFEYAAKNHLSSLEDIGSGEEWAYNSWSGTHMGGTDPVGPNSGQHTQKTRRDAQGTADNITGRLIRSIDGIGPALRLTISQEMDFPPEYVPPCDLKAPEIGDEPENSYRDPRWVTGSDAHWTSSSEWGNFDLRVWEDGTARMGSTDGQWFTSNNIAFVFVPSSGSSTTYPYIFLDDKQGSVLSDAGFMSGGYIGRIEKASADSVDKPTLSGLQSGAELAAAAGDNYKMVDMVNIPESAKEQDSRLLDGTSQGWFQDNTSNGGVHHYRKDVDPDEFRFTVNQGSEVMLANGEWFTVNNTFLRITHSSGYTCDYLYAVDSNGTFYHDSFQAYERADFRMFELKSNSESFPASCGSHCSSEIPKGQDASFYATQDVGRSTFVPAPCPAGGCN